MELQTMKKRINMKKKNKKVKLKKEPKRKKIQGFDRAYGK